MKLTRLLKYGMVGKDIKFMQSRLSELNYANYMPTGNFGPKTLKSIEKFQGENGLVIDGLVGNKTWGYLFSNNLKPIHTNSKKFKYKPSEITKNGLEIFDKIMSDKEYVKEKIKKTVIYLHHTAGSHRPDRTISSWDKKDKNGKRIRVGTHYVIGRRSKNGDDMWDGKVFRALDDDYWIYHLGVGGSSRNSESIGIELNNYGYCKLVDGEYVTYVGSEMPSSEIEILDNEWRGYKYFQSYTDSQIESLRKLLLYLIDKHDIEIEHNIYNVDWFNYRSDGIRGVQKGIRTHVNVRKDKTDCYPSSKLINMLNTL